MACAVNIFPGQTFPDSTVVKAYALPVPLPGEFMARVSGDPSGNPFKLTKVGEAAEVKEGKLALNGLGSGVTYLLWGEVGVGKANVYMLASGNAEADTLLTSASPNTVKVKTTNTEILAANPGRAGLQIVNTGATPMYLGLGKAGVLKEGIYLGAGGGSWDGVIGGVLWKGSVFGIAETAEEVATAIEV